MLRQLNREKVLRVLAEQGPLSRSDLLERTSLSRTTVWSIAAELLDEGRLRERPPAVHGGRGRPPWLLQVVAPHRYALGIELSSEVTRALVATPDGTVVSEVVDEAPPDAGEPLDESALRRAAAVTARCLERAGPSVEICAAVVAVPSPVSPGSGTVLRAPHVDVPHLLGLDRLGCEVVVRNDADLAAVGEAAFGAGRTWRNFVHLSLDPGPGAGLVLDGALYRGRGFAGDIGHVRVVDGGPVCWCGNRGCLSTVASADALRRGLWTRDPRTEREAAVLQRLYRDDDHGTRGLLLDAGRALGRAVSSTVAVLDPEAVIVADRGRIPLAPIREGIEESLARFVSPASRRGLPVVPGTCRERDIALGAVALGLGLVPEVAADRRETPAPPPSPLGSTSRSTAQPASPNSGSSTARAAATSQPRAATQASS